MNEPQETFRKSTHSQAESNCLEVAVTFGPTCAVRDSKWPDGPLLVISPASWDAFLRQFS
ncbi:DUF397 domain-containing protein [Streptomyces sp. NPDC086091]|uniref:DUF397 domain-containing protein n=1 Tax=Streptomyces sp. NPDC086091 TaxID=3365751 RepID=UPI0038023C86